MGHTDRSFSFVVADKGRQMCCAAVFSASLLDAGRIARVFGGLGQLLHAGLGIIEGDNRFACLEGHVNFADAFDLGNRLNGDRTSGAGHTRYGQRDGHGWQPHGATTAAMAKGKQFFMMNSCD